jgi:hypothetical protein
MLAVFASVLHAQSSASALNGAWQRVSIRTVRPDSTLTPTPAPGICVIIDGHYSQIYIGAPPAGVQQASRPTTAEEKAARYDILTANAGSFTVHDSTVSGQYDFAKSPTVMGTKADFYFRRKGDTLWTWTVTPFAADSTKRVRSTTTWVRAK